MENSAYKFLLIVLGTSQAVLAAIEFLFPLRAFEMWRFWIAGRFFPFHGVVLILIGIPLTIYKGYLSGVIFIIGLFIALMGPFVLVYPEKIRGVFAESDGALGDREKKAIIYFDALFRFAAGVVFFISCWKTFFR